MCTQDIFFTNQKFSKKDWIELFNEAKKLSYGLWIDGFKGSRLVREPINLTYDQIITCFENTERRHLHTVFIHRMSRCKTEKDYIEIGFCTLVRTYRFPEIDLEEKKYYGDLFLWINVDIKYKEYLIKKYKFE